MGEYSDQVHRMWDFIKKMKKAREQGFWLETICLSYTLIEIQLRFLLGRTKLGKKNMPLPVWKIDNMKYLMQLATLAKDNSFIDQNLWAKIKDFNDDRIIAIHQLAKGKIEYDDLKEPASKYYEIVSSIQSCYIHTEVGPEEKRPDNIKNIVK